MKFERLKGTLARHLKPLYVQVHVNGRTMSYVFVDGESLLNVMALNTLKGFRGSTVDLKKTYMRIKNFTGNVAIVIGFFDVLKLLNLHELTEYHTPKPKICLSLSNKTKHFHTRHKIHTNHFNQQNICKK